MNIHELADKGMVMPLTGTQLPPDALSGIAETATFKGMLKIGHSVSIYAARVGASTTLGDDVGLERKVYLDDNVILENGVHLHAETTVFRDTNIGQRSTVGFGVIIGRNVTLPAEVQIGNDIVIPSTKAIVALGRLGTSARTVTIHGSDTGPRFSIGCQNSVSEDTITTRIMNGTETSEESAAHYREYLPIFSAIGRVVQNHYDAHFHLIEELRAEAAALAGQQ